MSNLGLSGGSLGGSGSERTEKTTSEFSSNRELSDKDIQRLNNQSNGESSKQKDPDQWFHDMGKEADGGYY